MGKDCERADWLMSHPVTPSFSTELSPHSVDMAEAAENPMTIQPIDPAAAPQRPRRRRQPAPTDPRRSPDGLATDAPPGTAPADATSEPAPRTGNAVSIAGGVAVLRAALRNVPAGPGVYRMLDRKGDALYVGKARNLKSRVQNYTHPAGLSN